MTKVLTLVLSVGLMVVMSKCADQSECCINIDIDIYVELQNADGEDLLDPSVSESITKQDIDVYYEIDGKLETYASLNKGAILDNPDGFDVQSDGTKYLLRVFSNPTAGNHIITLVRIKDRPEIKLITKVERNHGKQITGLRYNDLLVWTNSMSSQPHPTVTVKFD